jgi:LmbE family N-acetylglucosaminyl deacetylase
MSLLIVVAHPDDEILGCGGTAAALAKSGYTVTSCILSGNAEARRNRPKMSELNKDISKAHKVLGIDAPILGSFPNIRFNTVPHLELVRFIEGAISKTGADVIFTHHPGDLNNDHLQTSLACQAAARLSQRQRGIRSLKGLFFMEIPSSTDWAFASCSTQFTPDTFFSIGENIDVKVKALQAYRGVMREQPHPRSERMLRSLAALRGGQSGFENAEAFQTVFRAYDGPGDFC